MNSTNRVANRLFLLLVGLVLLALGGTAVGLSVFPDFSTAWDRWAPEILADVEAWLQARTTGQPNWLLAGVLAVAALVLLIVLLAVFVLRQGRGRTDRLVTAGSGTDGTPVVDTALAADVLTDALSSQPDLVGSHVSAYRVRTTPMLDVTVTCRRGASPRAVSDVIDDSLSDLENLVGAEIPALVQIRGRFWSRRRGGA